MTPLRIGLTVDPIIPVPPRTYGGIERIAAMLVTELTARGHEVTLFGHPESRIDGRVVGYGVQPHAGVKARALEVAQLGWHLRRHRHQLDLVHSFGRLRALTPILPVRRLAKIQSYQRPGVPWPSVRIAERLSRGSLCFTGCSSSVYDGREAQGPHGGEWHTIFNGVVMSTYTFAPAVPSDAPLVFLGRIERIKGTHDAIAIARQSGRRLVIAGNTPDRAYFEAEIAPHVDGDRVSYIGPVDDAQKNALLGRAAAMLFPIDIEEAFGIVVAEAMACGTPVIGYARGAVPEIIRHGVTGFVCHNVEEAVRAVAALPAIARSAVHADCEARFSSGVLASQYEELYLAMVDRCRSGRRAVVPAPVARKHLSVTG